MQGLTAAELKLAVEEALSVWGAYAPLNFVEVADSGPLPTSADSNYAAAGRPQIRFGHHPIDGPSGPALAHAYLPYSEDEGLVGDVHFDRDEDWSGFAGGLFLETVLHETGHALRLDHELDADAIMNPVIAGRFTGVADSFLLADDIDGIRDIYGEGIGSVTPLEELDEEEPDEEEPSDVGNVTAEMDSDSEDLLIAGDALDNHVLVTTWWCGTLVWGLDKTTVNGERWDFFWLRNTNIHCELGSGNDLLRTFLLRSSSLQAMLGEGDDELSVYWSWIRNLTANGGTGDDSIRRRGALLGTSQLEGFEFGDVD